MTATMSETDPADQIDRIRAEMRAAAEKATRTGLWAWFGNSETKSIYLATVNGGRRYIMSFIRWGMRSAQPQFRLGGVMVEAADLVTFEVGTRGLIGHKQAKEDSSVYRFDINGIASPDATHIAVACPVNVLVILDAFDAETAARKAAERQAADLEAGLRNVLPIARRSEASPLIDTAAGLLAPATGHDTGSGE